MSQLTFVAGDFIVTKANKQNNNNTTIQVNIIIELPHEKTPAKTENEYV